MSSNFTLDIEAVFLRIRMGDKDQNRFQAQPTLFSKSACVLAIGVNENPRIVIPEAFTHFTASKFREISAAAAITYSLQIHSHLPV